MTSRLGTGKPLTFFYRALATMLLPFVHKPTRTFLLLLKIISVDSPFKILVFICSASGSSLF